MGVLATVYMICALRTNVAFVIIFLSLIPAFGMLTAGFWFQADDWAGNVAKVNRMFVVCRLFPVIDFAELNNADIWKGCWSLSFCDMYYRLVYSASYSV